MVERWWGGGTSRGASIGSIIFTFQDQDEEKGITKNKICRFAIELK